MCSTQWLRKLVSTNKKRLESDKYNLDLTYITNRIVACGYPAAGMQALYRNRREDVADFLKSNHGSQIKIYNLCAESKY